MDENNLSINIRARILPVIEGSSELKAEISNLPSQISNRMGEAISSPAFQEGLSSQQIQKVKHLASLSDTYEFEKIQERQKEITDDLQIDLDRGKLTASQQKKHLGRFAKYGQSVEGLGEFVSSELDDPRFDFLNPAQKTILRASAKQGTQEAVAGIGNVNQRFEEINYANEYVRNIGKLESEQFQRHKNLEYDLEEGGFTKARGQRYLKEERGAIQKMEEMQQEAKERFAGTEFGDRVFKTIGDDIEVAKQRMKDFSDEIEKAGKGSGNLLQSLKAAGVLAMAGVAVDAGLKYAVKTEQIEAAERTGFSFESPLAMYNAREQAKLFQENTQRTRDYELAGGAIGAGAGALGGALMGAKVGAAGGPWGVVGGVVLGGITGYMTGAGWGAQVAEKENIPRRAEIEEELKFFNESSGTLGGYVGQARNFDIERARIHARIGNEAFLSNVDDNLGFRPDEKLQMRGIFSDSYGKWDEELYGEQTTFARAKGIDPNALYGLNVSARLTGQNVGISGLEDARKIATAQYGENVTSQRIVDVLNDLKNINERMLDVNMNMDSREASQIGLLPSLIFGKDSAYSRLGDRAAQGLAAIDSLGKPGSQAEDAWLYNAYGGGDLNKFAERKKLGIMGSVENFNDIARQMNRDFGGDEWLIERRLHATKDGSIPTAGMIPDIAKKIAENPNGFTQEDFDTFIDNPKFKTKTKEDYEKDAKNIVPESLAREEKIAKTINEAADKWRTTVYDMAEASTSFWKNMGDSAEYHKLFMSKMTATIGDMDVIAQRIMKNLGIAPPPKDADYLDGSDTIKTRFDEIKDRHNKPATGWAKKNAERLREFISDNTRGEYLVNLLEGYDPTGKGHAPGSPHYKNSETEGAMDIEAFRMNDKGKMIKIPKDQISKDPALSPLFREFAKENNITWGGTFNRSWENGQFVSKPDPNHFESGQKEEKKSQFQIDYEKLEHETKPQDLATEKRIKEKPTKSVQLQKDFEEQIIRPKETLKPFNKNHANILGVEIKQEGKENFPLVLKPGIDYSKLEHVKKLEEIAKHRQIKNEPSKPEQFADVLMNKLRDNEGTKKDREHSFFEISNKSRAEQNPNVQQQPIDYRELAIAIRDALQGSHQETIKEIVIRDKTTSGISAEHMEATSANANSIFGGSH